MSICSTRMSHAFSPGDTASTCGVCTSVSAGFSRRDNRDSRHVGAATGNDVLSRLFTNRGTPPCFRTWAAAASHGASATVSFYSDAGGGAFGAPPTATVSV